MMVMGMLVALLVLFGIFASFILKEKVFDERDDVNRSLAGRNAFLVFGAIEIFKNTVIHKTNVKCPLHLFCYFIYFIY